MAIEISNLNPAGSDLFAGEESFLTDLQEADSDRVFGGGSNGNKKNKNSKNNNNNNGGIPTYGIPVFVPVFVPVPVYGNPYPSYPSYPSAPQMPPCGCGY
jgi:hypothetical protein